MKRLPILIFIALGVWLFSTGYFPNDRELVWTVERPSSLRLLEVQLYDSDGTLVKREERPFPQGATGDVVQTVKLGSGTYRAQLFVRYEGDREPRSSSQSLTITGEKRYFLKVPLR